MAELAPVLCHCETGQSEPPRYASLCIVLQRCRLHTAVYVAPVHARNPYATWGILGIVLPSGFFWSDASLDAESQTHLDNVAASQPVSQSAALVLLTKLDDACAKGKRHTACAGWCRIVLGGAVARPLPASLGILAIPSHPCESLVRWSCLLFSTHAYACPSAPSNRTARTRQH